MSRQHQRHHQQQQLQQQQQQHQQQQLLTAQQQQQQALLMAEHAAAAEAAELFDLLCVATTMRQILALHRAMCEAVGLRPSPLNDFYPKLKAKVRSWKAQALWKKFDARAAHRVYGKGNACSGTRVLVIGAGPCGLRTAIEAQLLGAKVVVLEKRDRITRNNVLHLWPFVITDLRNLGAKKFYGKFCAGSIDHISIRQLQCMLLKVALLLGVEIHEGVSFDHALEPSGDGTGWRAAVTPADHAVSHYEFDVLIGADGKRNMLDFRRKEFRGKLAIAITANFINKKTEAEAKVEEISGVAFIFNQAFFKELYSRTGIDLENIVYYKDETHYFVMTAKKHSLIDKGVIIEDMADPAELLAQANVDTQKLHDYAREAAEFSTQYQMPNLEFAVNHYGKPDVAMFDFTSMFAAEMSCRVVVRKGCRLLQCLVGDSLLEPFWPTGSGCARGFLSSMDAAYAIKLWSNPQNSTLGVLAQRESIYRLLNQTTPDTLQRDISAYTVDPATRYPNLNRESVNSWQVKHLIDTDDPAILEQTFMDTHALQLPHAETPGKRKRRSGDTLPQGASLLRWISAQLAAYQFTAELKEPSDVFRNGRVLCALINRYRPDLIDFAATKEMSPLECNELAFAVLERELHIDRVMNAKQSLELTDVESRIWLNYLDQICELFRGEIPHIKHPKMDFSDLRQKYRINHTHAPPDFSKLLQTKPKAKSPMQDAVDVPTTVVQRRSVLDEERAKRQRRHEQLLNSNGVAAAAGGGAAASPGGSNQLPQAQSDTPRRSKKRRQADKTANIVQTESESTSPDEVELNSATEISTDSEFDNDEIIRQAPKIFIDDTHLRKPTKVQIKSGMITPSATGLHQKQLASREKGGSYLQKYQPQPPLPQFKPLVQVDPTLLISSQRAPLQNPRPGDYLLNKTASTEGIASKKSLELKKRYLLGEPANGNKIQKSGSTSVLDSRIRSFQSNISECQKLLNPSSDISAGMRSFLDRTKLGDNAQNNELMRSATSNVINDLRVELKIQKAPSSNSTDNEKENVFVNSKNELNKGMEYTDAVNATLLEQLNKKSSPTTPTNNKTVIEVIDLVTPEKPVPFIDLTVLETPKKATDASSPIANIVETVTPDSNKISDVIKPDVSKDVKECIPDILGDIKAEKEGTDVADSEEQQSLLCQSDEEKRDSPEKANDQEPEDTLQIQVPNIPWTKPKSEIMSTTASSATSCSSSGSSSIEDIQHYILESTTSPDTQTAGGKHNVPRLEVHDSSGALMQVDSLMIVNGKYIGDPEDVKFLDMPAGVIVPPAVKTTELEEEPEADVEPVTATPEPAECTVIEATTTPATTPPALPEMGPPKLKFDSKNENKIESLKHLPLIVERTLEHSQAVKPITLNLSSSVARTPDTPTTPTQHDSDKTPTGDLNSRSDSETEATGTGQVLTETELSDWTADDCISENFVDMEFVINSNKGTMKRRNKERRRNAGQANAKLPSSTQVMHELAKQAPVAEMEGILHAIDIDDIEFMDTGSEGSCAEAYSATNTALLHNRGYMEYIETVPKARAPSTSVLPSAQPKLQPLLTKRDEKLGIDYIEQGAYIMHDDAKTPVNEAPRLMTQSLTDSSTLNELDEDSLAGMATSQTLTQTQPTTTEESEALTVVTSPLDTSSPRVLDQFASMLATGKATDAASTPSSSEQQPKTTQSTVTTNSSGGGGSSSTPAAPKDTEAEDMQIQFEYVRALQQRISQISTQRRKSSKGEAPNLQQATVIDASSNNALQSSSPAAGDMVAMRPRSSSSSSKVPEIPTLNSKLEEISKERTKQKDLIHDLVMDKLQSKKQLNAEKRLHRSRQRSLLTSGYASGASLSPTPKLAAASSSSDANCSSQAHYHVSTAAVEQPSAGSVDSPTFKQPNPLQKSATASYVSPYRTAQPVTRSTDFYKARPFSEHIDAEQLNLLERHKLNKTASFSYGKVDEFATPKPPVRPQRSNQHHREQQIEHAAELSISASTENLRSEARARARLKSNSELGLSPEEKMQLLRKRLQYDQNSALKAKQQEQHANDLAARAIKMSASKSVNDLAYIVGHGQQQHQLRLDNDSAVNQAKAADFTSDPNLAASVQQDKPQKSKTSRRQKDPERRKSLIQSLSSFFHKGTTSSTASSPKEQGSAVAANHSAEHAERPGTSSSGTPTISDAGSSGGGGGVFSRFRISPKSKEKSKSCFDLRTFGFGDKEMITTTSTTPTPTTLATATTGTTSQTTTKHSQDYLNLNNTTNNSRYRKQTNTESFSSSSPQLYIHKPHHHLAAANAMDDQTPPPIPPLPLNYQRSDDESNANETREHKKQRAISKASRQAELKRLRIAQEIQREQEEIEVQLKELEARGVLIEKALRGEAHNYENLDSSKDNDEKLLKELLEIWRNITALKKRDEELTIRQQELQLEYRHAQLKEELNLRLSCNKLDKSSADVAAEGAILNEMLEIVAKRAALRPTASQADLTAAGAASTSTEAGITLAGQSHELDESNI
ncbi:F-actin-monooxygenase Mical isoform X12 [Drosophila sulfurigaster albostrigata]|uniref:F-actin-monooxygenase Mical isoform X12 n=1 Tax=Drosophila sulfurigaster albostrigata TaxID=89887 RepID=UPI002D21E61C|nr:F-actin-monooxygenase Mical isoform X12 [Drosophila sulfurigaster albostrigata]